MLLTLLLAPAFRHGQNECYVVTGFREGYTETAHLSFKEPVSGACGRSEIDLDGNVSASLAGDA